MRAALAALIVLGVVAGVPSAAEAAVPPSVFWANFLNGTISRASLDGSGGGGVSTSGVPSSNNADGVAIDPASGRIYWANRSQSAINFANLDGSGGGGALNTSGATLKGPSGVAIDESTGRIYWANNGGNKISYAHLDGSGGGDLNTTGATVNNPEGVTIDRAANRIYWANPTVSNTISYAHLDGSGGGGNLSTAGATTSGTVGPSVDPAGGRVYWTNFFANKISFANTNGTGGGGDLNTTGATVNKPAGVTVDRAHNRIYWANFGSPGGISYANLDNTGSGGNINVTGASPSGPFGSPALYFGPPPTATTGPAGSVTPTGATLNGTVNPNAQATTYHFEYGTNTSYGSQAPASDASAGSDSSNHAESQPISGLTAHTTYHFRIVATNGAGRTAGADQVFTTSSAAAPSPAARTLPASNVTGQTATVNGTLNPNKVPTTYHFDYGPSVHYGHSTTTRSAGSGTTAQAVSAGLTGLTPHTTYHVRLVATNAAGTTTGGDVTFTTKTATRPLRLVVRTSGTPRAGARVCYALTLTSTGHPVAGGTIRLAGRTTHTNHTGHGRICITLSAGYHTINAAKRGYRTLNGRLLVRPAPAPPRFTG